MTSQTDRKLILVKPSQKTLDDAVDRAFKAILALNPCLRPPGSKDETSGLTDRVPVISFAQRTGCCSASY